MGITVDSAGPVTHIATNGRLSVRLVAPGLPPMHINELHLSAVRGDKRAERNLFEHLTVRFRLIVQHRIGSRADSEEIVQEALKTIAEKYRDLEIHTSFAAWCHRIVEYKTGDYIRKRSREAGRDRPLFDEGESGSGQAPSPEMVRRLTNCLRELCRANRRYGRVLNLHYQGYGTAEICEKIDVSTTNLYALLSRARSLLARCLEKEADAR